jgi:hypothetical protein
MLRVWLRNVLLYYSAYKETLKLRGLNPRANYTELVGEVSAHFADRGSSVVSATNLQGRILGFLDRICYYFFQIAPQLYSRGWVDPVLDLLLLTKSGSAGKRTRDLRWQELKPLVQPSIPDRWKCGGQTKWVPLPQGLGLGVGLTTPSPEKNHSYETSRACGGCLDHIDL